VRATFNANITDPHAYDLVCNVAQVPFETLVDLIVRYAAAHARHQALAAASAE
jgi:hypothetical protein